MNIDNSIQEIALAYIHELEKESGIALQIYHEYTVEKPYGFVYFYQSEEYIKTGEFSSMLAGNAPFLITKDTGEILVFGTANNTDYYLAEYERTLNQE